MPTDEEDEEDEDVPVEDEDEEDEEDVQEDTRAFNDEPEYDEDEEGDDYHPFSVGDRVSVNMGTVLREHWQNGTITGIEEDNEHVNIDLDDGERAEYIATQYVTHIDVPFQEDADFVDEYEPAYVPPKPRTSFLSATDWEQSHRDATFNARDVHRGSQRTSSTTAYESGSPREFGEVGHSLFGDREKIKRESMVPFVGVDYDQEDDELDEDYEPYFSVGETVVIDGDIAIIDVDNGDGTDDVEFLDE